jgi:hypothetical protein
MKSLLLIASVLYGDVIGCARRFYFFGFNYKIEDGLRCEYDSWFDFSEGRNTVGRYREASGVAAMH